MTALQKTGRFYKEDDENSREMRPRIDFLILFSNYAKYASEKTKAAFLGTDARF